MNWPLLINSLLVSALTTVFALALGLMAALWLSGLGGQWRARWIGVAIVALSLPPFLVTNAWLHYVGTAGTWHGWLPVNIYSLGGTVWILSLLLWPIPLFAVLGAWRQLEASQLESDMAVTGFALLRGLLLPLARGPLVQAAVLTFVLALNDFGVPAILQVKVFTAEVWILFNTTMNSLGALEMSWPLLVLPFFLLFWFRRAEVAWPRAEGPVSAKLFRQQLGAGWSRVCGVGTIFICVLSVVLPLAQLATAPLTWSELPGALAAGQSAIWNSIYIAVAVASLCLALSFISWRWPIGTALWIPFFVPGVFIGIALIAIFNRPIFEIFYQHVGIVFLALGLRYLAFGWNGIARAMRGVDRDLTDVARLNGASHWQLFRHVQWPQISSQATVAWYVIFLLCLWDVESMLLVVPPGGETLALRIFNLLHFGHNAQVNSLCLALLALAVAPLILWQVSKLFFQRRRYTTAIAAIFALGFLTSCSVDTATEKTLDSKLFSKVVVIGSRGVGVGEFNKPRSIAVDREDNIYVVDMTARVQKFTPDGQYVLQWQLPQTDLGKPKGMGCDKDGNVIVIEPHYQRINIFSVTGKLLQQWGHKGTNVGELIMPRAVAINSRGDFLMPEYTVVDRVQEFTPGGTNLVRVIGHTGVNHGEFDRPEGIAVDAADNIYVADSCNHRIQIFSPNGKFLRTYGKPGNGVGEMSYPYDVRVDKAGLQFVCEFENSRVQVFDTNGQSLEILGGPGASVGKLNNPYAIALDSHGNLYVADSQNHRVQKFIRRNQLASR
ncbi:MAG TPA: 6-bladed beta-propeller [Verrucomicrobiae bacterium]|jgi:ABC-type Fe3+ transport system permease subunit/DNA-binding beta-propeller fold protein YncE|nr:6-bladed beta-propeller [Verrucomicrobiae bacterium]